MPLISAMPSHDLRSKSATLCSGRRSSSLTRLCGPLLASAALLGCSGASWQKVEIDSPYEVPKAMTIVVVARPVMKSASAALSSALLDGLASRHIKATLIPESSGTPDATVSIVKWDPGSRGLRWLAGMAGGGGEVIVTVESLSVDGTARGWVHGGFLGGSDDNSAEAVGDLIADTIATGLREPVSTSSAHGK